MLDTLPRDIFGVILSQFEAPEPALFAINKHCRYGAIEHFSQRRPEARWLSINIRAALLCHSAEKLSSLIIVQHGLFVREYSEYFCVDWKFCFDGATAPYHMNMPLEAAWPIHPSIVLVVPFIPHSAGQDPDITLYALYSRVIACGLWEVAVALEKHCNMAAALGRCAVRVNSRWYLQQVTYAMRDNVHMLARLRKDGRYCNVDPNVISDEHMFDIAVEYGCWKVARHILETSNGIYVDVSGLRTRGHIRCLKNVTGSRAIANVNKIIEKRIRRAKWHNDEF